MKSSLMKCRKKVVAMKLSTVGTTCLNDTIILDWLDRRLAQEIYDRLANRLASILLSEGSIPSGNRFQLGERIFGELILELDLMLRRQLGRSNQDLDDEEGRKAPDLISREAFDRVELHMENCPECRDRLIRIADIYWKKDNYAGEREDYELEESDSHYDLAKNSLG